MTVAGATTAGGPPRPRVAILFHRFGPYHICRLDAAARHMAVIGIEFSSTDRTYAWSETNSTGSFPRRVVSADIERESVSALIAKVSDTLDAAAADAVAIAGWSHPAALAALLWCARTRTPAIVMSDSAEGDEIRSPAREAIKRRIVSLFSAGLVAGAPHRRYLAALGMADARIRDGFDVVDNDHFASGARSARTDEEAWRAQLGLRKRYFLSSCRMIAKKNLSTVLDAYRHYRAIAGAEAWDLVLMGDGPMAAGIQASIVRHELTSCVHMPGFRQYHELPVFYALAGAFVLASTTEQWGLVVNEAMAPFDPAQLADLMETVTSNERDREAMGRAGQALISDWSPDRFGGELRRAVDIAMAGQLKPSLLARLLARALIHRRERTDG